MNIKDKTSLLVLPLIFAAVANAEPLFQTQLSENTSSLFNKFGSSVAISGDIILVGAPGISNDAGQSCVFRRSEQSWNLDACLLASSPAVITHQQFGLAVAIAGDYSAVAATEQNGGNVGVVYLFKHQNDNWAEIQALVNPQSTSNDYFGAAVSMSSDYLAIGSPSVSAANSGSVYIYKKTDSGWAQDIEITSTSSMKNNRFGSAVMLSGDYLIIGDHENGNAKEGTAYIYKQQDQIWKLQASLKGGTVTRNGDFGISVAISDYYAVVGAKSENNPDDKKLKKSGAVYVYKRTGTLWNHQAKLIASDSAMGNNFGTSVALSGDYITVGTEKANTATGVTYLFNNNNNFWTEQYKFEAADPNKQDHFGHAVAIAGDYLVIGAHNKEIALDVSGAAYTYDLNIDTTPTASELELDQTLATLNNSPNTLDSDGDDISDSDEINILGTDPTLADTDNDGLTDKEEITIYQSNPLVADTDGDGLSDLEEVIFYNSDPTLADTDGDGFSDFIEVTDSKTDPALVDSDSDGFTDQQELTQTNTNPTLADTDGDGLSDNEELNIYQTNPLIADSDNDGFSDGNEVNYYETDPLDAASVTNSSTLSTSFSPAEGETGTMAFEDEWPLKGDYDFNDAVFNYNIEETKQDGLVKQIVFSVLPVARGAIYDNSLRLLINTPVSNVSSAVVKYKGTTSELAAIADGNKTLFIIIDKIEDALPSPKGFKMSNTLSGSPKVTGQLYKVTINFNSPLTPAILGAPPYNSFIARVLDNGEMLEVHFPGKFPTKQASRRKFGQFDDDSDITQDRYYQTKDNLPWAMQMPAAWHHTKERVDLSNGYPDILNWASSKGKKNKNWYKSKRKGKFVFEEVPDI
ncbi:MAG: LruC domain-containing protein [Gammaproteobacteria bacterium]|nr:LruC domain-containing protein [Gammaproteobacteria bacterium]